MRTVLRLRFLRVKANAASPASGFDTGTTRLPERTVVASGSCDPAFAMNCSTIAELKDQSAY